ncbi:hypothetical protein KY334_05435, partial [Candidatus Woesearchaeota archaeon]|nr:hypothetical protein [Candidatus Woesearchaeota archaeon]
SIKEELNSLRSFKASIEKVEKDEKLKNVFSMLTSVLTKEEIDDWKKKSETINDVEIFEKEIKSFACDKIIKDQKPNSNAQFSRMAVDLDNSDEKIDQNESVWTRISKRVSK